MEEGADQKHSAHQEQNAPPPEAPPEPTKKDQVVALYLSGMRDVEDLAMVTGARPSYVGQVLQEEKLTKNYFDLYTSTQHPMNVYSKFFAGKLGFKDMETAERSVALIDRRHEQFATAEDRAGQHHALLMALTMFNRARWTGKGREADVFRRWLVGQLRESPAASEQED